MFENDYNVPQFEQICHKRGEIMQILPWNYGYRIDLIIDDTHKLVELFAGTLLHQNKAILNQALSDIRFRSGIVESGAWKAVSPVNEMIKSPQQKITA